MDLTTYSTTFTNKNEILSKQNNDTYQAAMKFIESLNINEVDINEPSPRRTERSDAIMKNASPYLSQYNDLKPQRALYQTHNKKFKSTNRYKTDQLGHNAVRAAQTKLRQDFRGRSNYDTRQFAHGMMMDNAEGGPVLQSKNRINEVINQFGRSQQILDHDRTHFQRDRHSGLSVTNYLSNSPDSIRHNRNQKQHQFKSFHK